MAADQEQVRRTMTEFVNKTLPPSERGPVLGAITRALRRPDLVRGDPGTMYRNAFRVMQAIENRSEDVHRGNLIADIKKISGRILDSPSVDLAAKRILQRTLREINLRTPQKGNRPVVRQDARVSQPHGGGRQRSADAAEGARLPGATRQAADQGIADDNA